MKRIPTYLLFASLLSLIGCPSPARFKVDVAAWRAAKAARPVSRVAVDGRGTRFLAPHYVPKSFLVGESEIEVHDPGLELRKWGAGLLWTGGVSAIASILTFALADVTCGDSTPSPNGRDSSCQGSHHIAGWSLVGLGGAMLLIGGVLMGVGDAKAEDVLLPPDVAQ